VTTTPARTSMSSCSLLADDTVPAAEADVRALLRYIDDQIGDEWTEWPGGRPGEIEVALVDAVMSIRARYGRVARDGLRATGVHRAVAAYREVRAPTEVLDDLRTLASLDWREVEKAVGRQVTSGVPKAAAIVEAAQRLVGCGVTSSAQLNLDDEDQRRAYTGVTGLGWVTWEYFGMLLGQPGVKADRWVIAAVADAVARPVSPYEARDVVLAAAAARGHSPTRLEHALWAHRRRAELPTTIPAEASGD
jgi:hypothetical protein